MTSDTTEKKDIMENGKNDLENKENVDVNSEFVFNPELVEEKPKLKHMVIDSGAIIKGVHVENLAENFWTTEDVMQEIRDKNARKFLRLLPFELKTREPSEEAMAADFSVLSRTDRRVIALAYMLEKEANGSVSHLRVEPVKNNNIGTTTKPIVIATSRSTPGISNIPCKNFATPEGCSYGENCKFKHIPICRFFNTSSGCRNGSFCRFTHINELKSKESEESSFFKNEPQENKEETQDKIKENIKEENKEQESSSSIAIKNEQPEINHVNEFMPSTSGSKILYNTGMATIEYANDDDDDDSNWINSDNFMNFKESPFGNSSQVKTSKGVKVGIITTDYSMQNVILQMGLKLLSADGMVIGRVKQWILRCIACFTVSSEMDRLFCPKCGNSTMERVSFSMDSFGNVRIYTRADRPVSLLGTKYSLPAPKGGRDGDLLLREDQLMMGVWGQRKKTSTKKVNSVFGEDVTSKLGISIEKRDMDIQFGYGRKNPNAQRGRERRGKKKSSH